MLFTLDQKRLDGTNLGESQLEPIRISDGSLDEMIDQQNRLKEQGKQGQVYIFANDVIAGSLRENYTERFANGGFAIWIDKHGPDSQKWGTIDFSRNDIESGKIKVFDRLLFNEKPQEFNSSDFLVTDLSNYTDYTATKPRWYPEVKEEIELAIKKQQRATITSSEQENIEDDEELGFSGWVLMILCIIGASGTLAALGVGIYFLISLI